MRRAGVQRELDAAARHATARWLSHPPYGAGRLHSDSRAFEGLPFSIPDGPPENAETTPGELLAAAYSAFVATYLAQHLDRDGVPARELVVDVWCTLSRPDHVPRRVEQLRVDVRGRVNDIDDGDFNEAVRTAWGTCVESLGLRDDLRIELRVLLA